ncbi:unnamed protein product [Adineta steineri]|uniref:Uncharacterized protein n=1 Tax=Adineta steineri TaxID=433720 RepID=A0A814Y2J5_9BILA|nr:unnamed protein product [Adineta steineri]CAF3635990.1 unnamed protein product [Adineta steineri]
MPIISPNLARLFFFPSYGYTHLLTFLGIRNGYDKIDNTVYVGILPTIAMQKYLIEHEKVNAVISMNEDYELTYVSDQSLWAKHEIQHLRLPTVDFSNPQVENLFHGVEFLRTVRQANKTAYIHCKAGRQRSANLAACYLIDTYGMTPEEAARSIRSIRPSTIFGAREMKRLHDFMSVLSTKKKNVYIDRINESLLLFNRNIDKFNELLNILSQLIDVATGQINDIEKTLGNNDDDDDDGDENEEQQMTSDSERELIIGGKLCELNEDLNTSLRELRQSWSTLEKQGAAISKSVFQLPKFVQLFLDTTKADPDFNDPYFRFEMVHFSEQFPIVGQFYYELCLEIQVNFLDLSSMKSIKHLSTVLELLSSRLPSISGIDLIT